jgi:hypothetical protein
MRHFCLASPVLLTRFRHFLPVHADPLTHPRPALALPAQPGTCHRVDQQAGRALAPPAVDTVYEVAILTDLVNTVG